MQYLLHFDGATHPNPGLGAYGWQLSDGSTGKGVLPGTSTNNVSEYAGLGFALKHLTTLPDFADDDTLIVRGDSQLIINQVNGSYQCNSEVLQKHLARIHVLIQQLAHKNLRSVVFEWVPRDSNGDADALSRAAWEEASNGATFPVRYRG